jgi:hypothetical protein
VSERDIVLDLLKRHHRRAFRIRQTEATWPAPETLWEAAAAGLEEEEPWPALSPPDICSPGQTEEAAEGWESAFRTAIELAAAKRRDAIRLQRLERAVEELQGRAKSCWSTTVSIASLAPEPFDLIKPIPVIVQPSDDEFIASFFDANINASGCTETDAVANLKDVMLGTLEVLLSQPPDRLGPGPTRQLAVLSEFIRRWP